MSLHDRFDPSAAEPMIWRSQCVHRRLRGHRTAMRTTYRVIGAVFIAGIHIAGCQSTVTPDVTEIPAAETIPRVLITEVKGLTPPVIPQAGVYMPTDRLSIGTPDGGNVEVASFELTVNLPADRSLRLRVTSPSSEAMNFTEVGAPDDDDAPWSALNFVARHPESRDHLAKGIGVFTTRDEAVDGDIAVRHLGVILPAPWLASASRMVIFTDELNGVPVGEARLNLVTGFYYVGVVGDSIVWGNGLRTADKIPQQVEQIITSELGVHVVSQNFSQTGAPLATFPSDQPCTDGCWGEVPRFRTSIQTQIESLSHPEVLDLIIMDGCFNDVGLTTILDPFVDQMKLEERTTEACDTLMSQTLESLRSIVPKANIVVLGLFPIVGEQSDLFGVEQTRLVFFGDTVPIVDGLVEALAMNSTTFWETGQRALRRAIGQANMIPGGEGQVALANPGLGPDNAIFTPSSKLWNMAPQNDLLPFVDIGIELLPEDPMTPTRWQACLERGSGVDTLSCLFGSVGHPNPEGALAYVDAVVEQLQNFGVLPPPS